MTAYQEGQAPGGLLGLAEELAAAARSRVPVPRLSARFPYLTLEDAYRIQRINVERRVSTGAGITGHKIGLTSRAMQEQMGIGEPDSGFIFDGMVRSSGSCLHATEFMNPRIETEIAFRLGDYLSAPSDLDTVRGAVAEVFLAFEILDTCFTDWNLSLVDSVADNAACAGVIAGDPVPFDSSWDLGTERVTATANGEVAGTGEGRDILGDPLKALVWLTHRLPSLGTTLRAGDIILAGSVHASIPLTAGTDFHATSTRLPSIHLRVA